MNPSCHVAFAASEIAFQIEVQRQQMAFYQDRWRPFIRYHQSLTKFICFSFYVQVVVPRTRWKREFISRTVNQCIQPWLVRISSWIARMAKTQFKLAMGQVVTPKADSTSMMLGDKRLDFIQVSRVFLSSGWRRDAQSDQVCAIPIWLLLATRRAEWRILTVSQVAALDALVSYDRTVWDSVWHCSAG